MTPEVTISDWQVTPVIIKTGGGDVDPVTGQVSDKSQLTISLDDKTFESPLKDDKWRSAMSTVTAGIVSILIQDGLKSVGPFTSVSESEELTTLQVICGPDVLMVSEEALPEPHRTMVVINSPIPFSVIKHGAETDKWSESGAPYPVAKPLVIFTQGGHVLANYQCETTDLSLTLGLDWDETGG
jgi:hypothetical protein